MKKSNFEIIKNNNKEILIDCSESLIDSQLEINFENIENIFLEVPILKTLFSIKNTVIGIRERVFFKRFIIFLVDISNFSNDEKEKFLNKISNDNKLEAQLIEIIDRIEEDEKIKLMSNLLKNYINEKLTKGQFFRYTKILVSLSFIDIEYLKSKDSYTGKDEETYFLASQNLIFQQGYRWGELSGDITLEILETRIFKRTILGENFIEAIKLQ